jgi:hypothetical protein
VFHPDPALATIAVSREQVVALFESINQPQISIPRKPAQAVQAWLCGTRNAGGTYSVYVVLHLLESAERVVYVHDPRELRGDGFIAAETEGLHFLESMGFMLDNQNFPTLMPDQQERALARVQALGSGAPTPGGRGAADPAALARLLASF